MDFNKSYTVKTRIGRFMMPIFQYTGDLNSASAFLDPSLLTYHGNALYSGMNISASTVLGSSYYLQYTPFMGEVAILNDLGNDTIFKLYSKKNNIGWNAFGYLITGGYGGESNIIAIQTPNQIAVGTVGIVVDSNDNYMLVSIMIRSNDNNYAYYSNTATRFGYFEGPMSILPSFTRAASSSIFTSFSTDFAPFLYEYVDENDPYDPIEPSAEGGGQGTFDFYASDSVAFPPLPEVSANTAGFVSLWTPTNNQLLTLAGYLWNKDLLTSQFWKKLIANPIELIFGLSIIPVDLTDYVDGTYSVVVGWIDTKILMRHLSTQWITVDCGEIDLKETWGSYLDYDPFTKLEIYLPFCGIHPLKIDDFMPGKISLSYNIDLMTGSCVALVKSTKTNDHGDVLDSVVYQFMGNCATQIPITAQQFADAVRSAISIAASIGSMVATGVGGTAAAIGAKTAEQGISSVINASPGLINTGASAAENVMNIKPSIERSGAIGFSGSLLGVRTPYIILTRPRMARPEFQSSYTGYPSFITESLGDLSGLTIVQAIHLEGISATADEINEIESLLKGGVFF